MFSFTITMNYPMIQIWATIYVWLNIYGDLVCSYVLSLQLFCVAVLIAASVTISAVNDVEDDYEIVGQQYKHASDYRGAAVWLLLVAVMAIVYHGIATFIRILYYTPSIKNHFGGYSIMVSDHHYHSACYHTWRLFFRKHIGI